MGQVPARGDGAGPPRAGSRTAPRGRAFDITVSTATESHPDWAELEAAGRLTPFQTQAWLRPWYRLVAPALEAEPAIVSVRERASGKPLMLLPLCRRRERGLRIVEFAGIDVSDYNAPLLAQGFAPDRAGIARLLTEIQRALGPVDLLRLERLPALLGGLPNPLAEAPGAAPLGFSAWSVPLPASRDAYDRMLDPTMLKELRRKGRRLAGRGAVELCWPAGEAEGRGFFAELRRQRGLRFAELGRSDILGDPVFCRFYEAVLFDEPVPVATMAGLCVDGEVAATMLALQHRGAYLLVMSAFDASRWKSASPGAVAIDQMVTRLIGDGFSVFDLTIGDERYKRDFGAVEQRLLTAELAASWRGAPSIIRNQAKAALKRALPEPVLARLRGR